MVDGRTRPKHGHVPLGFLGALVLILLAERAVSRERLATLGGSQWACQVAGKEADSGASRAQVLCFGDSVLKQGLAPTVIEAKGGMPAYNFAMAGGQAPGDYFLLRRALASGARPSAVVVELFPKLMATEPKFNVENWPFLANPADCFGLARACRDPLLFADLVTRELIPSVRCRNSIRANLLAALNGSFVHYVREIDSARRNWKINRGAEIVASRPGPAGDLDLWMKGYFPEFACDLANRHYIKKFLDLAARHQIPVFWVLPPYQPALQARCEKSGFDAAHVAFIRALQARYPGLYVLDGRHANYDPAVFSDFHHLGREGAEVFSADVARRLRAHRDDPSATARWQGLAEYRPIASGPPLEDMNESRRKIAEVVAKETAPLAR